MHNDTYQRRLAPGQGLLSLVPIEQALSKQSEKRRSRSNVTSDYEEIGDWDSTLISFLFQLSRRARERDLSIHYEGIPKGALRLVTLAEATPKTKQKSVFSRDFPLPKLWANA